MAEYLARSDMIGPRRGDSQGRGQDYFAGTVEAISPDYALVLG